MCGERDCGRHGKLIVKNAFLNEKDVLYYKKVFFERRNCNEARKDIEYKKVTEYSKEGRMWRVPDFLPVSMQDFLHCRKPDMRAVQIRHWELHNSDKTTVRVGVRSFVRFYYI